MIHRTGRTAIHSSNRMSCSMNIHRTDSAFDEYSSSAPPPRSPSVFLPKPQNGIRPVAMGETVLKLCGTILLQRHESALQVFFAPIQRGILQRNACESIVRELLEEYDTGHALLTVDFKNAYNTPQRNSIVRALLGNPIFKPFMRLFYFEYGLPPELLFFANNSLYSTIESTSGIRQGSALSSLCFCALLQGPLLEIASLYPEVKIRAYQDDVTMSSNSVTSLEAAFLHLREITTELNLHINFQKCEWFQKSSPLFFQTSPLQGVGVSARLDSIKVLGAFLKKQILIEHEKQASELQKKNNQLEHLLKRIVLYCIQIKTP